jgi:hypothetical protein
MEITRELKNYRGHLVEIERKALEVPVRIPGAAAIPGLEEYEIPPEARDFARILRFERKTRGGVR